MHNIKKIKKIKNNKALLIFISFFIFYFVGSMLISYCFKLYENYDFTFEADAARVFGDYTAILGNHYRSLVHPLFVLIFQPIILVIKGFVANDVLAVICFSSTVGALSTTIIYLFSKLFFENKYTNYLITLIFGISFSNLVFTCSIELYNLSALILIFLWYIIAKIFKEKLSPTKETLFLLYFLGILTFAVTITNYMVFLIASFVLLISKKVNFKKLFILNFSIIVSCILLTYIQNIIWHNTVTLSLDTTNLLSQETTNYSDFTFSMPKLNNVISSDYYNAIMSTNIKTTFKDINKPVLVVQNPNLISKIGISLFFVLIILFLFKNFRKNIFLNIGLILTLAFNTIFHIVYCNGNAFLYSEHFLYIFFLLFIVNYNNMPNKLSKFLDVFLLALSILIGYFNGKTLIKYIYLLWQYIAPTFFRNYFSTIQLIMFFTIFIILVILFLYIIYLQSKKLILKYIKQGWQTEYLANIFGIILSIILLSGLFIALETTPTYKKIGFYEFSDILETKK